MAGRIEFIEPGPEPGPESGGGVPSELPSPPHRSDRRRVALVLALVAAVVVGLLVARAVDSDGPSSAVPAPTVSSGSASGPAESSAPVSGPSVSGPSVSGPAVSGPAVSSLPLPRPTAAARPGALGVVLDSPTGAVLSQYCPGSAGLPDPATGVVHPAPQSPLQAQRCAADAAFCPEADDGENACASEETVPSSVLHLVRVRYPNAQLALANTEIIRETGGLWYRLLLFSLSAGRTLRIDVIQRHTHPPAAGLRTDASGRVARVVAVRGTLATVVTLGEPVATRSDVAALAPLASDAGLAALG